MSSTHSHARSVDPLLLCDRWNIRISGHTRETAWQFGQFLQLPAFPPTFLLSSLPTFGGVGRKGQPTSVYFSGSGRRGRSTKLPEVCSFGPIAPFRTNHERRKRADGRGRRRGDDDKRGLPSSFLPSLPFFHFCYLICSSRLVDPIESGRTHLSRRREGRQRQQYRG